MEPLDPRWPESLLKCREDQSVPVRLVGEADAVVLPATEVLTLEAEGINVGDAGVFSGGRARITSHRFYCWSPSLNAWVAIRLDRVMAVELLSRLFRSQRCVLKLMCGRTVSIKLDSGKTNELVDHFSAAVAARKWQDGSYEVATTGGLARVLARREAKQQATGETLDVALSDLKNLRQYATQAVAVARQVAQRTAADGSGDGQGVQDLLRDFGLVKEDGGVIATGGSSLGDVDADVERICEAALSKRGGYGMLLVHDVFCLVNRARGTALVSPDEVMRALRSCSRPGRKLRLRLLGTTGALAVSLARSSDAELDERLVALAAAGPLSAFTLAQELGVTSSEAQYLLRDAESRAAIVRDEAPDGVFYYPNFFDDY